MKTSYGLEFNLVDQINPYWSEYDKMVASCHLANVGVIIIDAKYAQPIDNEYDLDEIYPMVEKLKEEDSHEQEEVES